VERRDGPAPNGGIFCLRLGQVKENLYDFPVFGIRKMSIQKSAVHYIGVLPPMQKDELAT
jgi:hypothetical protein